MFLSLARIIKFSFQDILRNIWLSLVIIIILVLTLFTVNMLLVVKVIGDTAVGAIKDKVDVNLYLKAESDEENILALKAKISSFPEIKDINYISKIEALEKFKLEHQDNPEILQALREIGKNPLTPMLIIKPANLDNFETLINKINAIEDEIIESRNFANYKLLLEKINAITKKVGEAGLILSSIFILATLLVIYNSVRVAIYTHKREIMIMRLVGASKSFIQMPYLISSLTYTLIGIIIVIAIFYPFLALLQPYLEAFFVGYNINLLNYFKDNFFTIFGVQFLGAALINVVASYIAVRKYSKV